MKKERGPHEPSSQQGAHADLAQDASGSAGGLIEQLAAQMGIPPGAFARELARRLHERAGRADPPAVSPTQVSAAEHVSPAQAPAASPPSSELQHRRDRLRAELLALCQKALIDARAGGEAERRFLAEGRGIAGVVSDFFHDTTPPYAGNWDWVIRQLERAAEHLRAGDLRAGHRALRLGLEWLHQTRGEWHRYLGETMGGAADTIRWLERIRDGALVAEVGLLAGGAAYGLIKGGALATGSATLLGAGASTATAAALETPLGEEVRGALAEIATDGPRATLRQACQGVGGVLFGMGEALSGVAHGLYRLFGDPRRFAGDLAELPGRVGELWAERRRLWTAFSRMEPRQQAFEVGRLVGHLEAMLALAEAGGAVGEALGEGGGIGLDGVAVGVEGGAAVLALRGQLLGLKGEAEALVFASGATVAAPGLYAMGIEEVRAGLGDGPQAGAMNEVGAREAGVVERPVRHHVFPQEMRRWFEERGFVGERDIDRFCIELEEAEHQALHGGGDWQLGRMWEGEWNRRVKKELLRIEGALERKLTFGEIMRIVLREMDAVDMRKPFVSYR